EALLQPRQLLGGAAGVDGAKVAVGVEHLDAVEAEPGVEGEGLEEAEARGRHGVRRRLHAVLSTLLRTRAARRPAVGTALAGRSVRLPAVSWPANGGPACSGDVRGPGSRRADAKRRSHARARDAQHA